MKGCGTDSCNPGMILSERERSSLDSSLNSSIRNEDSEYLDVKELRSRGAAVCVFSKIGDLPGKFQSDR